MKTPLPWFERSFEGRLADELLPNLYARLRGTPARLEDVFEGRGQPMRVAKAEGKWSAQEHAGHLLDLETLWLARVEDYVECRAELTTADLSNRKTHEANHNARPLEEILTGFRAARAGLIRRSAGLDQATFERPIPHPRLRTPMRLGDHLYFVAEHDDHHLAQIWELIHSA